MSTQGDLKFRDAGGRAEGLGEGSRMATPRRVSRDGRRGWQCCASQAKRTVVFHLHAESRSSVARVFTVGGLDKAAFAAWRERLARGPDKPEATILLLATAITRS